MLKVKKIDPNAILPTVAHAGEDLGFDLYALEDTVLPYGITVPVRTGIAARFGPIRDNSLSIFGHMRTFGLLIKDRSSMAVKGITVSAGVIDAGYVGELKVLMTNGNVSANYRYCSLYGYDVNPEYPSLTRTEYGHLIRKGDKIAQMLPTEVFTAESIIEVDHLVESLRGDGGFGSTGA